MKIDSYHSFSLVEGFVFVYIFLVPHQTFIFRSVLEFLTFASSISHILNKISYFLSTLILTLFPSRQLCLSFSKLSVFRLQNFDVFCVPSSSLHSLSHSFYIKTSLSVSPHRSSYQHTIKHHSYQSSFISRVHQHHQSLPHVLFPLSSASTHSQTSLSSVHSPLFSTYYRPSLFPLYSPVLRSHDILPSPFHVAHLLLFTCSRLTSRVMILTVFPVAWASCS